MQVAKTCFYCNFEHDPIQIETNEIYPKCPRCFEKGLDRTMELGRYFYRGELS